MGRTSKGRGEEGREWEFVLCPRKKRKKSRRLCVLMLANQLIGWLYGRMCESGVRLQQDHVVRRGVQPATHDGRRRRDEVPCHPALVDDQHSLEARTFRLPTAGCADIIYTRDASSRCS